MPQITNKENKIMKKNHNYFSVLLILVLVGLIQSCKDNTLFDDIHNFKGGTWAKGDTAVFKVDVQDTLNHDFILSLRTTTQYEYSNLWIYVMVTAPDSTTSKVAEKIPLAYPDGSWIGRVSGSLVESRLRFDSKSFPIKGEYIFKITNATQQDEITDIQDIGLRIE